MIPFLFLSRASLIDKIKKNIIYTPFNKIQGSYYFLFLFSFLFVSSCNLSMFIEAAEFVKERMKKRCGERESDRRKS